MSESLGKTLKKVRESKHLSIEEVSERTRIPKKIISSIEEDRLNQIDSPFYARCFVKSYSQFLGAMEEEAVKEYLSGPQKKDMPRLILEGEKVPGDFFIKYKKHIGLGILAIFSIWVFGFGFVQMKEFVKNVVVKYKARSLSEAKPRTSWFGSYVRGIASGKLDRASPVTEESKKKEGVELEITARSDTWLQVITDDRLLFRGVLKKRESDIWRAKKEIRLELGNAGGVILKLNEKNLGSPGRRGEKKSVIITKDGIK